MISCPVCGSEDVRRSHKNSRFDFIKRWRGLQRYRCRECRKAFYQPLSPADRAEDNRARRSAHSATKRRNRQRRTVEICLFLGMLVIFYVALKFLIRAS